MSQEHATSHPPPKANPSIIAIVGLLSDHNAFDCIVSKFDSGCITIHADKF